MVARLPTEQEVVGSIPTLGCSLRYGVVGNMSGSHPVASGSIPGIGCDFARGRGIDTPNLHNECGGLAQMVERSLSMTRCYSSEAELPAAVRMVRGSIPRGTFSFVCMWLI